MYMAADTRKRRHHTVSLGILPFWRPNYLPEDLMLVPQVKEKILGQSGSLSLQKGV
jgi:hypothetical protein